MKPLRFFPSKKAQVEVQFNWIYVLIAGAVILAFFGSLVIFIKGQAEDRRAVETLNALNSIFVGAGISEKTKNFIETPEVELVFACQDGISSFNLKQGEFPPKNPAAPIFSPAEIKSKQLAAWSLPYKFPFKIMDILMLSSAKDAGGIKYYIVGESPLKEELKKNLEVQTPLSGEFWPGFDVSFLSDLSEAVDENNYAVRFIFLAGPSFSLPVWISSLPSEKVTGLSIANKEISFLSLKNNQLTANSVIPLPSIAEENDPLIYAAIFADSEEAYLCQMQKVFNKMSKIILIYESKTTALKDFYQKKSAINPLDNNYQICGNLLIKITEGLAVMKSNANSCVNKLSGSACQTLLENALAVKEDNTNLMQQSCAQLY